MDRSDDESQDRKFKEMLARAGSDEARRASNSERHARFAKRDEILLGRQAKAEARIAAEQRSASQAVISAKMKAEASEAQRAATHAVTLQRRLESSWGQRLGHYKGTKPRYLGGSEWGRLTPAHLLRRASLFPPKFDAIGRAVTDFSKWVFHLEHPTADSLGLEHGKIVERSLLHRDRRELKEVACKKALEAVKGVRLGPRPRWRMLYQDDLSSPGGGFPISQLRVNGQFLVGRPDLVLQEVSSGEVFIIERKASNFKMPTNCWHNVRAQLWAYSKIDEWAGVQKVTLCAEVWRHRGGEPVDFVVQTWKRGDPILETSIQELFEAYCPAEPIAIPD